MSSPTQRFSADARSDAALRREVIEPAQSWMLQAPAGSGKTELLMQRFLACLATVEKPESVLAITFTRKAAAEMRNRILVSLERAALLSEEQIATLPLHQRDTLQLARSVLGASKAQGWSILSHPARLQIRTLDSFCEAVAQRAPLKGLLGGAAQVTEDAKPLYVQAAQRAIDELATPGPAADAVAALLSCVDNNVGAARELLASMLAQREQWLHFLGRSDVFDRAQQLRLRDRLESALALAVEEELQPIREHAAAMMKPAEEQELFALVRYRAAQSRTDEDVPAIVESIAASAETLPLSRASALRDIADWPTASADSLPAWRAIADFLLVAGKADMRRAVDKRSGFPAGTNEQKVQRKRCIDLLSGLATLPCAATFCGTLHGIRRLPDPRYTDAQWQFMLALLELLPRAAAHLQVVFSERAEIDFSEYARRALDAIGEEDDPTELGLQLGYRIRHILVDEFQDTNRVQLDLLARLLSTWQDDEPGSIFCVGDPMQSIYAFRQADIAIYQQAIHEGIGRLRPRFGCLTRNFRSQAKLVEWFNEVFPKIFRAPSELTNAVGYAEVAASRPPLEGDAVEVRGFALANRAAEAKHLAECIQRELARPVLADAKPSTIAVLVRARTHLPELVTALRAAGIAYRAVKTDRLSERPLVRDLEALRAALTDLADRTAWLAVLRAPWCGLALADLLELCRGDRSSTVRELLHERGERLSEAARSALARCFPVLEDALARRGRGGSLRALVESTWLRIGGPACFAEPAQGAREAEAYFALLDEHSPAGELRDPASFAGKLRELFAPADPGSAIRVEIMPIHQAKGLEWDVVFLPALERRPPHNDKRLLYWRLRRRGQQDSLLLGPMEPAGKKKDRKAPTVESFLRDLDSECSREELKRVFYVAATRARRRLYLSAAVDTARAAWQPDADSILRLLWESPEMRQGFAPAQAGSTPEPDNAAAEGSPPESAQPESSAPTPSLRRFPPAMAAPPLPSLPPPLQWSRAQSESSSEQHRFEWVGELLPRVGKVTHSFLQRIALDGPGAWDAARLHAASPAIAAALAHAGVLPADMEQGIRRVSEALRRTLDDERGRWILAPHPEHRCELAVSAVVDGVVQHVRVDRTFVEDGTRWLIDYKVAEQLGGDPGRFVQMQVEKYRYDMERYALVLRALDAGAGAPRPVRCALYLPLLGLWSEVELHGSCAE